MAIDHENGLIHEADGKPRCWWCAGDDLYRHYHDTEWGQRARDDRTLFEKICLEGFQSGLSWLTILRKRENFRAAFANFEIEKVAAFTDADIERCVQDAGIVRHRGKIVSTINNARRAIELIEKEGPLSDYVWSFRAEHRGPERLDFATLQTMATTPESAALSKDLKKRGWSFVGPTTCYAFMQAMGMVDDHVEGCHVTVGERRQRAASKSRREDSMIGKRIYSGSPFEEMAGYARAVVDGDMIYVSGTTGFNPETMSFPDSVEEQAELCFQNIQRALMQARSNLENMLRVRVFVASREEFDRIKPIIKKYCDAARPANTTIICDLAEEQMRVEVEVTAKAIVHHGNER